MIKRVKTFGVGAALTVLALALASCAKIERPLARAQKEETKQPIKLT